MRKFRFNKIENDLESLKINRHNQIIEIGKPTKNLSDIDARYIGIIKTSKKINKIIISTWKKEKYKNKNNWGISGKSLNKAYMTDLINHAVNLKKKTMCYAIKFKMVGMSLIIKKIIIILKDINLKLLNKTV